MKDKIKLSFVLFPLVLVLVVAFRSGFTLNGIINDIYTLTSETIKLGTLQESIADLFSYFDISNNINVIISWYFSYIILIMLGFLIYELFLWFGSFIKSFR